jgi:hypothetical protein
LRNGARALLAQAVEAEVAALLSAHAEELTLTAGKDWCATDTCLSARS